MHTCIDSWMCVHALMHTCVHRYIHTYACTYIHGQPCRPNTHIHTDNDVRLQTCIYTHIHTYVTQTFQPRNMHNCKIKYF